MCGRESSIIERTPPKDKGRDQNKLTFKGQFNSAASKCIAVIHVNMTDASSEREAQSLYCWSVFGDLSFCRQSLSDRKIVDVYCA